MSNTKFYWLCAGAFFATFAICLPRDHAPKAAPVSDHAAYEAWANQAGGEFQSRAEHGLIPDDAEIARRNELHRYVEDNK